MIEKDELYCFAFILGIYGASEQKDVFKARIEVNRFRQSEILGYVQDIINNNKDIVDTHCPRNIRRTPSIDNGVIESAPLKIIFNRLASDVNTKSLKWLEGKDNRFIAGFIDGYKLVDKNNQSINTFLNKPKPKIKKKSLDF